MVPYEGVKAGPRDDYFHSQVCMGLPIISAYFCFLLTTGSFLLYVIQFCIAIIYAASMLVHCWSILRIPLYTSMGGIVKLLWCTHCVNYIVFAFQQPSCWAIMKDNLEVVKKVGVEWDDDPRLELSFKWCFTRWTHLINELF